MTAVWTTPKTWNTGDPLTASDMNTHIRDNLEFIKSPPTAYYRANEISDYTTTSTTYVNVDGVHFALTITTSGGDVLVVFSGMAKHSATAGSIYFDLEVDGVRWGGDDGLFGISEPTAGYGVNASFVQPIEGLSAGSHTIKLQWKTNTGTATLYAGAGTSGADVHPQLYVREVS